MGLMSLITGGLIGRGGATIPIEQLESMLEEDGVSGGSQLANYAVVQIDGGPGAGDDPELTAEDWSYYYPASALTILEQSGSDFSIGEEEGIGLIFSEAGGLIQTGMLVNPRFVSATLDAGNTDPRWIQLGIQIGRGEASPANSLGYDCSFQVGVTGQPVFGQQTFAGLPGVVGPGDPAINGIRFVFQNAFGTDSVTLDLWDAEALIVWTIAALA
jgi:hypothetical protein